MKDFIEEAWGEKLRKYSPVVLRIGMSLVFLWFGTAQWMDTAAWAGYVPEYAVKLSGMTAETLARLNGTFEILFGLGLLFGIFTRFVALLLALHMIHIAFTVGYNELGVRDFGLAVATTAIFMHGLTPLSVDDLRRKKENFQS